MAAATDRAHDVSRLWQLQSVAQNTRMPQSGSTPARPRRSGVRCDAACRARGRAAATVARHLGGGNERFRFGHSAAKDVITLTNAGHNTGWAGWGRHCCAAERHLAGAGSGGRRQTQLQHRRAALLQTAAMGQRHITLPPHAAGSYARKPASCAAMPRARAPPPAARPHVCRCWRGVCACVRGVASQFVYQDVKGIALGRGSGSHSGRDTAGDWGYGVQRRERRGRRCSEEQQAEEENWRLIRSLK